MNMKTPAALIALALLACSTWWWASDQGAESAPRGRDSAKPPQVGDLASPEGIGAVEMVGDGPIRVWAQPDFIQGYHLYYNARKLEVVDQRPDPVTGVWQQASYVGFASFKISHAATARDGRFALAGWAGASDDEFVIERWNLGSPRPPRFMFGTGTSVPFPVKNLVRTEIYRGPLGVTLRGFEFDAEERYMLAVLEDGAGLVSLYQFPNRANVTPVVVADSSTYPELASVRHIQKFDHPDGGRQLEAYWEPPSTFSLIFVDADNDGVFDGAPVMGEWSHLESIGLKGHEMRDVLQGPGA